MAEMECFLHAMGSSTSKTTNGVMIFRLLILMEPLLSTSNTPRHIYAISFRRRRCWVPRSVVFIISLFIFGLLVKPVNRFWLVLSKDGRNRWLNKLGNDSKFSDLMLNIK